MQRHAVGVQAACRWGAPCRRGVQLDAVGVLVGGGVGNQENLLLPALFPPHLRAALKTSRPPSAKGSRVFYNAAKVPVEHGRAGGGKKWSRRRREGREEKGYRERERGERRHKKKGARGEERGEREGRREEVGGRGDKWRQEQGRGGEEGGGRQHAAKLKRSMTGHSGSEARTEEPKRGGYI